MSRINLMVKTYFVMAVALLVWGCTTSNTQAPQFNPTTGQHPADWRQTHWAEFTKNPDQCKVCHGSTTDPALAGGTSKVSCFTCHPGGVHHPAGWGAPDQHGAIVKAAPGDRSGLAYCTKCHGTQSGGGLTYPSCVACHTTAPHPARPWYGTTASGTNHNTTDPANAPECYKCHANGAHSTIQPANPAPAGTPPGCTNATMCHGREFAAPVVRKL